MANTSALFLDQVTTIRSTNGDIKEIKHFTGGEEIEKRIIKQVEIKNKNIEETNKSQRIRENLRARQQSPNARKISTIPTVKILNSFTTTETVLTYLLILRSECHPVAHLNMKSVKHKFEYEMFEKQVRRLGNRVTVMFNQSQRYIMLRLEFRLKEWN